MIIRFLCLQLFGKLRVTSTYREWGRGGGGTKQKEKGPMNMDNSLGIAGEERVYTATKW